MFVCACGLLVINSASVISAAYGAPAIAGLLVTVSNGCGRPTFGILFDNIGVHRTMLIDAMVLLAAGASLVLGDMAGSAALIMLGILLAGFGFSCSIVGCLFVTRDYFGNRFYSGNSSIQLTTLIPASFIGPMAATGLQGGTAHSYQPIFWMLMLYAFVALALIFALGRRARKEKFR